MLKRKYTCPNCGDTCQYSPKFDGLCKRCFISKHREQLANVEIDAGICYSCGRIQIDTLWLKRKKLLYKLEKYLEERMENISVECVISKKKYSNLIKRKKHVFNYKAKVKGLPIGENNFLLNLHPQLCQECSRKFSGNLNEVILHIRTSKDVKAKMNRIMRETRKIFAEEGRGEYINIREVSKGIDISLSDRAIGDKIEGMLRSLFTPKKISEYSEKKKDKTIGKTVTIRKVKFILE